MLGEGAFSKWEGQNKNEFLMNDIHYFLLGLQREMIRKCIVNRRFCETSLSGLCLEIRNDA